VAYHKQKKQEDDLEMEHCTYYEILGVQPDATLEEITAAKNALAKVYHPDANYTNEIDTTAYMQEILEAFETLGDEQRRKQYDSHVLGVVNRVFKTYTFEPEENEGQSGTSFVSYWNAVNRLYEAVGESVFLVEHHRRVTKRIPLIKRLWGKKARRNELKEQLYPLAEQVVQYIALLTAAGIATRFWEPEAMNWVLVRWGHNQNADFVALFNRYEMFQKQHASAAERAKIRQENRRFQYYLRRLVKTYEYAK